MKKFVAILSIAVLLALMVLPEARSVAGRGGESVERQPYIYKSENPIPNQYLVVLNNDVDPADLETMAGKLALEYHGVVINAPYLEGINGFSIEMGVLYALKLSVDPSVGYVEQIPADGFFTKPLETVEPDPAEEVRPVEPEEEEYSSYQEPQEWGAQTSLISPLTPTPSEPLGKPVDVKNLYFRYGNTTQGFKTIALFGMSGSYLPHIKRRRNWVDPADYNPIKENCTFDDVGTPARAKYKFCVDELVKYGLNHLQIWVSMNHSVGMMPREREAGTSTDVKVPYDNEQPFKRTTDGKKWNLNTGLEGNNLDSGFFTNLKNVLSYCQSKGVIVAVVLFDPWQGWNKKPELGPVDKPIYSAYYKNNNTVTGSQPYANGVEFTSPNFFAMASNANATPGSDFIDDDGPNRFMREVQIAVMQRTVKELKDFHNFYWVIANEADYRGAVQGKALITWHRYMARRLREYEKSRNAGKYHLIAVNLSTRRPESPADDVLDVIKRDGNIDIMNSHYVAIRGAVGPVAGGNRYSAIKLLEYFNTYTNDGVPDPFNTKRWGFTEGKTTGTAGDEGNPNPLTADAARVEAWEFFMNGGALFDHLSYRWANPNPAPGDNKPTPIQVLGYYKLLSQFLSPVSLDGMKRMTLNQTKRWINPGVDGIAPHWAAMSNGTVFFVYMHRSTYKGDDFDRYKVHSGAALAGNRFQVLNMGCGTFRTDWFYPDGKAIGTDGGIEAGQLKAFGGGPFGMPRADSTKFVQTPLYKQDIVLKITKTAAATCQP